jgi:hypothetical protein
MKKLFLIAIPIFLIMACEREKSVEERYLYEGEKIVDVETGDEYIMEEPGQFTIVHPDGTTEKVDIDETPFFGTTLSDQYVEDWKAGMEERKEQLLEQRREQLRAERRAKYADMSDEEVMARFKEVHAQDGDMTLQRELIFELIDRGSVSPEEAPNLLEIDPELLDLDMEADTVN